MEYDYQKRIEEQERIGDHYEYWLQEACELLLKRIGAAHCLYLYESAGSVNHWPQEILDKANLDCVHIWALTKDFESIREYLQDQYNDF